MSLVAASSDEEKRLKVFRIGLQDSFSRLFFLILPILGFSPANSVPVKQILTSTKSNGKVKRVDCTQ